MEISEILFNKPEFVERKMPNNSKLLVDKSLWDSFTENATGGMLKLKNGITVDIHSKSNATLSVINDKYMTIPGSELVFTPKNLDMDMDFRNSQIDNVRIDEPENSVININKEKKDIVYARSYEQSNAKVNIINN